MPPFSGLRTVALQEEMPACQLAFSSSPSANSARLIHNGRFTPEYSWTYQQVIVNVGLFATATVASFINAQPNALADLRADLW